MGILAPSLTFVVMGVCERESVCTNVENRKYFAVGVRGYVGRICTLTPQMMNALWLDDFFSVIFMSPGYQCLGSVSGLVKPYHFIVNMIVGRKKKM